MATTTAVADLNKVQYSGLDFPTYFDDLRSELQTKFAAEFNDFAVSSLAIMLLDLTAYGLDTLSFYLDRRASDAFLDTAQTRKAVARLTRQLGYKMGGAISASTDLTIRVTNPVNFQVTIPQGFQFKGPNGLIFEAGEVLVIPGLPNAGASATYTLPVYEGETVSESFVGDGTANQVFTLRRVPPGKSVVQNSVQVLVNGASYTEVDFLPVDGGQFFEVGYNDSPATIRFGDGTASQSDIPAPSATISVTYIAGSGLAGQVAADTITKVVSNLVVNSTSIALTITNPEAAVGGDDPETLDSAKAQAGVVYKSRRVAVTQSDYLALAGSYADPLYGRVAVAQAYSTRSSATDIALQALLADISNLITPVRAAVLAQVTAIGVQTTALNAATTQLGVDTGGITTETGDITTSTGNIQNFVELSATDISTAVSLTASGQTELAGISVPTPVSTTTSAAYVQPAVGASVTVSVAAVTGFQIGQTVAISIGSVVQGIYTVTTVPTTTTVLLTLTSIPAGGAAATTSVALGAAVVGAVSDQLTQSTKALLTQYYADAGAKIAGVTSYLNNIAAENALIVGAKDAIDTYNSDIITQTAAVAAASTVLSGTISPAITAAVAPLDASTGAVVPSVGADLVAIDEHVNNILSSDCSANLVTVPILTRDADGFYAAPTLGLQQSLQAYLDERKAVTQAVQVTSGSSSLVLADVFARVGVLAGFSANVVKLAVEAAINGLLKNRSFGADLYISDLVSTILAVDGVSFAEPDITGPSLYVDAYHNLIVPESKVISKGTLEVVTVASY